MIDAGLVIADFMVRPTGVLVLFRDRRAVLRPRPSRRNRRLATEGLAHFAAKAGFGPEEELLHIYRDLPETYKGQLADLNARNRR